MPVASSEYDFDADMVVYAIGTNANPIIGQTSKLKLDKRGYIETDENLATSMAGVYAGGDIVTGAATVIEAMGRGAGRRAASRRTSESATRNRPSSETLFGIDARERNLRIKLAPNTDTRVNA